LAAASEDRTGVADDAPVDTATARKDAVMSAAVVSPIGHTDRTVNLTTCAWCNRIQIEGRWVSEAEAIRSLRSFEDASPPSFACTTCAVCRAQVERRRAAARSGAEDHPLAA